MPRRHCTEGDRCHVQAGEKLGDEIFYTDKGGWRDHEYVSLGVDHMPVLAGRTPIQACWLRNVRVVAASHLQCPRAGAGRHDSTHPLVLC